MSVSGSPSRMHAHSSAETFNEKPWLRYGRTRLDDRMFRLATTDFHRASRLAASAFAAVLFVMTAVPAVHASPNFQTILRKAPASEHTGADTLTWLLTFTEPVTNVDPADFVVSGTTAALALEPLELDEEGCSQQWDATLSGGDLEGLTGTVTLTVSGQQGIWGCLGNGEEMTHPGPNDTNHNTFVVNNDPESCSGGGYNPTPAAVEVTAVPIVVTSTTADYFVLYVRHELAADTSVEIPVLVKRGEAGTTTLAENVAAVPKERYRVEKYLADAPGMNPVNPAALEINDIAVAVPDRATFEELSQLFRGELHLQFLLFGMNTARPGVYFMNTGVWPSHEGFRRAINLEWSKGLVMETIIYDPDLVAPDGSSGVYHFQDRDAPFGLAARAYTVLAASMPLLDDSLAFHIPKTLRSRTPRPTCLRTGSPDSTWSSTRTFSPIPTFWP